MITSTPVVWAARLVSTFSSTSTLLGSSVKPMCVNATTASLAALSAGARFCVSVIGLVKVSPGILLGSSYCGIRWLPMPRIATLISSGPTVTVMSGRTSTSASP
ncbi:MAG: hypothetical protein BWY79_01929 [Actinobacteria bacterium ADurb.Bin444]|nr:MAG: hypothetical protein BWY79_01929 [Actinobacteria bacterium ADurb.Bin444]